MYVPCGSLTYFSVSPDAWLNTIPGNNKINDNIM
jgi:hypothetical protein